VATKGKSQNGGVVRATCGMDGLEDHWVDYDVSKWSVAEFRQIPEADLDKTLEQWLEVYSVDWHVLGHDGEPVKHPGRAAAPEKWVAAYAKLPIAIARWLSITPYLALMKAMLPSKKRIAGGEAGGDDE